MRPLEPIATIPPVRPEDERTRAARPSPALDPAPRPDADGVPRWTPDEGDFA